MICKFNCNISSWGNTRLVLDETGNKQVEKPLEIEKFDPNSVPLSKWADYELSQMEEDSRSVNSFMPPSSEKSQLRPISVVSRLSKRESVATSDNRNSYMWHAGMSTEPPNSLEVNISPTADKSSVSANAPLSQPPNFPSDDIILAEIRHILSTADLMTITKKIVREQLTKFFGVDISSKKQFIHKCIDSILKGEL
jgi:chitin synthase